MTTEDDTPTFTADYVKQLREENASWRNKLRETETQVKQKDIAIELAKRGIDADPSWLNIPEGMTATEVVDKFAGMLQTEQPTAPTRPNYPQALPAEPGKVNASGPPPAQGAYGGRSLDEIKADPKAREEVRRRYREMLAAPSYSAEDGIYGQ